MPAVQRFQRKFAFVPTGVTVTHEGGQPATLYDATGNSVVPSATIAGDGTVTFYAEFGRYRVRLQRSGGEGLSLSTVLDGTAGAGAGAGAGGSTSGTSGTAGSVGPTGPKGDPGDPGAPGAPGAKGDQGEPGVAGADGPQGPQGVQGPQGDMGPVGPAGITFRGAWSAATTYVPNDSVAWGGSTYFALDPAPAAGTAPTGTAGDPGTDDDAVNTGWALLAHEGARGPQGLQGPQGIQGVKGDTGATGPKGDTGETGPAGVAPPNVVTTDTVQDITASKTLVASAADARPLTVRGMAGQTANLLEAHTPAGVQLSYINPAGSVIATHDPALTDTTAFRASPGNASSRGIVVRGAASQTANLQEWQDSTGAIHSRILADGSAQFATQGVSRAMIGPTPMSGQLDVSIPSATPNRPGIIVRGAASQTANLAEFQNSAGTVLSFVRPTGGLALTPASGTPLFVRGGAAGTAVAEVRGAASQTANLAEFQNAGGVVLSGITAGGALVTASTDTGISAPAVTLDQGTGNTSDTGIHVRFSNGATFLSRRVVVGALDSAGTGFRTLRVAN